MTALAPLALLMLLLTGPLTSGSASAQDAGEPTGEAASAAPAAPPQPPPPACEGEPFTQFDFWAGHWEVSQGGQPAGVNHIEIIDGGCALLERWTSARGNFTGHSLNFFDRGTNRWRQLWVDSGGTVLQLEGSLRKADGKGKASMVLEGESPGPDGRLRKNRISWTPNEDGTVRQHWQVNTAGDWTTVFDGLYRPRATAP